VLNTDGTWHAKVGGAQPGVVMQRHPQLNRRFRQEWLAGEAADTYRIIDRSARICVPARVLPARAAHRGDHVPRARHRSWAK
jgi:hypothetical protein